MKVLKKRTCLKCKKTKTQIHYKEMPNGRLNPKCNECRNQGRQPIERVNKKANFYDKFLGITITLISLLLPLMLKKN